jgi:hypothetical protein
LAISLACAKFLMSYSSLLKILFEYAWMGSSLKEIFLAWMALNGFFGDFFFGDTFTLEPSETV